jgi:hypothetical protein
VRSGYLRPETSFPYVLGLVDGMLTAFDPCFRESDEWFPDTRINAGGTDLGCIGSIRSFCFFMRRSTPGYVAA